jgi:hypothetical protein
MESLAYVVLVVCLLAVLCGIVLFALARFHHVRTGINVGRNRFFLEARGRVDESKRR